MSYTFPEDIRWESCGAYYMVKFAISINQILSCNYLYDDYYEIRTKTSRYRVITCRIPEFEAMLPKFPYDCVEYIAELEEKIDNNGKRMEILETNMNKLLLIVEKLSSNANSLTY